jgi:RNA methyltransferase, TrmH family
MSIKKITSTSNEIVKHAVRLQKEKSYRTSSNTVLVEGKNLLLDLTKKKAPLRLYLVEPLLSLFQEFTGEILLIDEKIAKKISMLEAPEGCFAEYPLPTPLFPKTIEKALLLDRLQDPGNVGTLLRTALAFGVETIFFIEPCCDVWNPKVIRSAKGAHFELSLISTSWDELAPHIQNFTLYVADIEGEDIGKISPSQNWVLVLGNEAHGSVIPSRLKKTLLRIPMSDKVESLNVAQAGAIVLYCLRRNL